MRTCLSGSTKSFAVEQVRKCDKMYSLVCIFVVHFRHSRFSHAKDNIFLQKEI